MTFDSPKEIWDYLKEEYEGDEHVHDIQMLNLMREFDVMGDSFVGVVKPM